jgi:TetR/AcrR family transcriptional regulator
VPSTVKDPRARPRSTADKILDAAEERFAQRGYDATSLADIATDVGIRTPSLYKHFASKQDLFEAVLRRLLDPYFELLGNLLRMPTSAREAEQNLEAVLRHYVRTPNLARVVQHAALAGGEQVELVVSRWYGPLFERAAELTARGPRPAKKRKKDALALVVAFHSMLSGYVTLAALHEKLLGEDPHEGKALARHLELIRTMARSFWIEELAS